MIHFSKILQEISTDNINSLLDKIKNKQFKFFDKGANGRVYEINETDYLFKITTEIEEYRVAEIISNKYNIFNCFIPVYYVDGQRMYIMSKATPLPSQVSQNLELFYTQFKNWRREVGGEKSVFEFIRTDNVVDIDSRIINFVNALQQNVQRIGISEFDLDIDFRPSNIMQWNGNLVMIDW